MGSSRARWGLVGSNPDRPAQTWPQLVLRAAAAVAATYVVLTAAVRTGVWWVVALTVLALLAILALLTLRVRGWDRRSVVAATVSMVAGAAAAPYAAGYVPIYFVIAAGIVLLGEQAVPYAVAAGLVGLSGVVLVVSALVHGASPLVVLVAVGGYGAIALGGLARRQYRARERQDRELVARSRELEQRSAELIAQTELTRAESTRAAALEERSRIARDIHDVLAHALGGLVVQLDAAEAQVERGDLPAAAERLRASRSLAVEGLREARKAVNELHEPSPAPADLVAALAPLVRGPVGLGVAAALDVVGDARPVPGRVAAALVAVTREALTNVNKHAPGGPVAVTVVFDPSETGVEIGNPRPDAGRDELATTGTGSGLAGMRERMSAVGGHLTAGPQGRRWLVEARCPTGTGQDRAAGTDERGEPAR